MRHHHAADDCVVSSDGLKGEGKARSSESLNLGFQTTLPLKQI
ncbi:hypothetical protein [Neisseria sicca]|nr:hypothetical protein [Neisseria sicca]